ncbi:MAG: type II CAAX endopeptidase family protein [Bacteroidota bacterium]
MKTIWNKIPAWGKALIFLGIIGAPVNFTIQGIAKYNLQDNSGWGWALLVTVPLLFIFWQVVSRWSPFNRPEDIKIKMDVNLKDRKVSSRILGLLLLGYSTGTLFTELFDVKQDHLLAFFETFKSVGHATAIPLLLVFALTAGVVEEVIFRGYMQNSLVRAYPKAVSFLAVALVFALVHFLPLPLVVAFLIISTSISIAADEFKSLGVVIITHITIDIYSLLESYFGFAPEMDTLGLAIMGVVFVISLFLTFNGNKNLFPKKVEKMEFAEVSSN